MLSRDSSKRDRVGNGITVGIGHGGHFTRGIQAVNDAAVNPRNLSAAVFRDPAMTNAGQERRL